MKAKSPPKIPERGATPRESIRNALRGNALSLREISGLTGISEKEIPEHLEHLERSLKPRGEKLVVQPATCLSCGFVFQKRRRFTTPGACPSCRSERIAPPSFRVQGA